MHRVWWRFYVVLFMNAVIRCKQTKCWKHFHICYDVVSLTCAAYTSQPTLTQRKSSDACNLRNVRKQFKRKNGGGKCLLIAFVNFHDDYTRVRQRQSTQTLRSKINMKSSCFLRSLTNIAQNNKSDHPQICTHQRRRRIWSNQAASRASSMSDRLAGSAPKHDQISSKM